MDHMDSGQRPTQKKSIVLVVSPLNALIRDQVTKLKQSGLKACILKGDRVEGDEEERKQEQEGLAFSAIENPREFQLIFAHPEALVGNKNVIKLLKTTEFKNRIKVIVVDEAHLVVDWKNFRPSYGKLATIGSILPQVPLLGLTATATKKTRTDIIESLGMVNPVEILGNPDRPNISFSSSSRPDRGEDKLNEILVPLVESLKKERTKFPFTVVFGTLETISSCYNFFSQAMGKEQYEPIDALPKAENRLFTQFHAQYPPQEKERIIDGLILGKSKLRIVFATVAFGVGLDLKDIRQIIHIGLPSTMEEYFQEAGRAGRDGLPPTAHIYYNSYDTSKARKHFVFSNEGLCAIKEV
ncbi:ATP-dependent DNA helicase Q-like 2 [Acropora cervicornis]|uniref:DNA 3'-5' helicase n=1 Tax=Acropora cervicornis TaxID=6130 RepID=A0AAD9Q3T9_ACRCE|nr:ATP-dependent DNA helicase Q-like 2 [Acropora cervicornis]